MPNLRVRPHAPDAAGQVLEVSPKSAGWDHVGFAVHKLGPVSYTHLTLPTNREV